MKRCPHCHDAFADALSFCAHDATALEPGGARTLGDAVHGGARLPVGRAVRIALGLCASLSSDRVRGRVPPPLRPLDVELSGDDDAVHVTLGQERARAPDDDGTLDPTAPYSAPEVLRGIGSATPATSVYNVAALLFEALTGDVPFSGNSASAIAVRQLLEEAPSARALRAEVPEALDALLTRALDKSPAGRPESPEAFAEALRAIELPAEAPAPSAPALAAPMPAAPILAAPMVAAPILAARAPGASAFDASEAPLAAPSRRGVGWLLPLGALLLVAGLASSALLLRSGSRPASAPASATAPMPASTPASATQAAAPAPAPPSVAAATPTPAAQAPVERARVRRPAARRRAAPSGRRSVSALDAPMNAPMAAAGSDLGAGSFGASAPSPAASPSVDDEAPAAEAPPPRPGRVRTRQVSSGPANRAGATRGAAEGASVAPPAAATAPAPPVVPAPTTTPPTPRLEQPPPHEGDADLLVALALGAAVLGLASMTAGVVLFRRRRASTAPLGSPAASQAPWPAPMPLPTAPPQAIPNTVTRFDLEPEAPLWKGTHPDAADAAYARTVQVPRGNAHGLVVCARCGQHAPAEARFCPNDGADLSAPGATVGPDTGGGSEATRGPAMKPFTVGHYRCESRLGEGGMGVVYRARHETIDRVCAVKVLLLRGRGDRELVERFRREARLAASISHPNSVAVYEYGEVDGQLFFLAMELIEGRALEDVMGGRPMPLARVAHILGQVCDGLEVAHAAGIVHRDLKPQNVMVCERPDAPDHVKIVDFGIARSLRGAERTLAGAILGTPAYMAPEQARAEPDVDARADVFAVGVMTYAMLSAQLPYVADGNALQQILARATLYEPAAPLGAVAPGLPAALEGVVARAIHPDAKQRTPTIRSFANEFLAAAHQMRAA